MIETAISFLLGIVLGVVICVVLILGFVFRFLMDVPRMGRSQLEEQIEQQAKDDQAHLDRGRDPNTPHDREMRGYYMETTSRINAPEKCDWFNLLKQRIFEEYRSSDLELKYRQRMNRKFKKIKDKPAFIGELVMSSMEVGKFLPEIQPMTLLPPSEPGELRVEFDVIYRGGFKCTIDTELWLQLPNKVRIASIPVSLAVSLKHLSGRMMVVIPPGHDPLVTASFHREPLSQFEAVPTVGKIAKLSNIPAASKFIVSQLQKFIRTDVVFPNGICLHIPLKASISTGRGMKLSTLRKVRALQRTEHEKKLKEEKREISEKIPDSNLPANSAEPNPEPTVDFREISRKSQSLPVQRRNTLSDSDFENVIPTVPTAPTVPKSTSTVFKLKERVQEAKKKIIEKAEQETKYIYADKYKEIKKQRELEKSNLKLPVGRPDPNLYDVGDYTKSEVSSEWEGSSFNVSWEDRVSPVPSPPVVKREDPAANFKKIQVEPIKEVENQLENQLESQLENENDETQEESDPLQAIPIKRNSAKISTSTSTSAPDFNLNFNLNRKILAPSTSDSALLSTSPLATSPQEIFNLKDEDEFNLNSQVETKPVEIPEKTEEEEIFKSSSVPETSKSNFLLSEAEDPLSLAPEIVSSKSAPSTPSVPILNPLQVEEEEEDIFPMTPSSEPSIPEQKTHVEPAEIFKMDFKLEHSDENSKLRRASSRSEEFAKFLDSPETRNSIFTENSANFGNRSKSFFEEIETEKPAENSQKFLVRRSLDQPSKSNFQVESQVEKGDDPLSIFAPLGNSKKKTTIVSPPKAPTKKK